EVFNARVTGDDFNIHQEGEDVSTLDRLLHLGPVTRRVTTIVVHLELHEVPIQPALLVDVLDPHLRALKDLRTANSNWPRIRADIGQQYRRLRSACPGERFASARLRWGGERWVAGTRPLAPARALVGHFARIGLGGSGT